VTKNALEVQESRFLQVEAALKHAKASVELAVNQREKARSRVAIAEKDLQDSLVTAPLSGVVSQRMREPGEMAEAGTPVLRIEDPTLLEVSAYLPSDAYASVTPGETEMRVHVGAADLGVYKVSYKSPTADQKLRTFEVKCLIANPPADVVPGLMVDVAVIAVRREGLGVPFVAVQRRNDKDVVFVVTNGTARAATLVQGLETDGWVEVTQSELKAGDAIVFRGQQLIDDGAAVDVLGEGE